MPDNTIIVRALEDGYSKNNRKNVVGQQYQEECVENVFP